MELLAFTDLHGRINGLREIIKTARNGEISALLCAGDLTFFGANLHELLKKFNSELPLFIIPGNHELPEDIKNALKKFKFVKDIHGKASFLDSCTIFGLGGSKITPFSTPFEMDDKQIEKKLGKFKKKKGKLILVTHEPPHNTLLDYVNDMHLGSIAIRKFIEKHQPDYCICGHFHENAGKRDKVGKTIVINPGPNGQVIKI
jgi:Icc-related predicted phosphoesterase